MESSAPGFLARDGAFRLHGAAGYSSAAARRRICSAARSSFSDVTYYVGHETVIHRLDGKGLPRVIESMFAYLQRNSAHVSDYFRLPPDSVVELGREIAI